ncbi:uncharacterized protein METZ01_LOCUS73962, partial [marine metagenome]
VKYRREHQNLRIPGPVPCPIEVIDAQTRPLIDHRGQDFGHMLKNLVERLKRIFLTDNDVFILTSSGTGALEASLVNTLSPGDKILAVVTGFFGQRYSDMAKALLIDVEELHFEWGRDIDIGILREALATHPDIKAVLVTHNETSTGVTNDLASISRVVKKEFGKLLLVDAVSSLGSVELKTDDWECDVVAAGSQKGLLTPPGLSVISFSESAWRAYEKSSMPKYYNDLGLFRTFMGIGQTAFTPAISLLYALDKSLELILREGLDSFIDMQREQAFMIRSKVRSLGLGLLAEDRCASHSVTAVKVPENVNADDLVDLLLDEYSIVVGRGQGSLKGKLLRVGHIGKVPEQEIQDLVSALSSALTRI